MYVCRSEVFLHMPGCRGDSTQRVKTGITRLTNPGSCKEVSSWRLGGAVRSCEGQRGPRAWGVWQERGCAAHLRTLRGSWLPRLSGCEDRARGRVSVAGGSVHTSSGQPPPLARCASWEGRYTLPVGLPDHSAFPVPAGGRGPSPRPARRPRPRPRPAPRLPAAF